jgi:hypothetical protein
MNISSQVVGARFEVLTAVLIEITVFWYVTPIPAYLKSSVPPASSNYMTL